MQKKVPSCSNQSNFNTSNVVIMTSQLISTNFPGAIECAIRFNYVDDEMALICKCNYFE